MAERILVDAMEDDDELEGIMQLVGFDISGEKFGVNILAVQEIIRSAPVTGVPNSPGFIEGVINLRGDIIPVIDLRKRLNLYQEESNTRKNWILILNLGPRVIGFVVDQVTEVMKVAEDTIDEAPDIIVEGLENQYIHGVCDIDGRIMIILDFEKVLFNEEYKALGKVVECSDKMNLLESEMI